MRTQKQIAASRANGRKSHGAVTPEGKARIVNANLSTGIYAEYEVLTAEFSKELEEVRDEYYEVHPPHSPEARCLLDEIVRCEWHLRRLHNAEAGLWDELARGCPQDSFGPAHALIAGGNHFQRLQYRINSIRRAFLASLRELERLEARDRDVEVIPTNPDGVVDEINESHLQVLGSLRQPPDPAPENPAPADPAPHIIKEYVLRPR